MGLQANTYVSGTIVTITAQFTNAAEEPIDPDVVAFGYQFERTDPVQSIYNTPGSTISRIRTGLYTLPIDTTGLPDGVLYYQSAGQGGAQAVSGMPTSLGFCLLVAPTIPLPSP